MKTVGRDIYEVEKRLMDRQLLYARFDYRPSLNAVEIVTAETDVFCGHYMNQIIRQAELYAKKKGANSIVTYVSPNQQFMESWYQNHGFQREKTVLGYEAFLVKAV